MAIITAPIIILIITRAPEPPKGMYDYSRCGYAFKFLGWAAVLYTFGDQVMHINGDAFGDPKQGNPII